MNVWPSALAIVAIVSTTGCGTSDRTAASPIPTAPTVVGSPFPAVQRPARVFDVSGAVSPTRMSALRPSNVMMAGAAPTTNSCQRMISITMRKLCG